MTNDPQDLNAPESPLRLGLGTLRLSEVLARRPAQAPSREHPDLDGILGSTFGIAVYRKQVDGVLQTICGLCAEEAEATRVELGGMPRGAHLDAVRDRIVGGALARGYAPAVAERAFDNVLAAIQMPIILNRACGSASGEAPPLPEGQRSLRWIGRPPCKEILDEREAVEVPQDHGPSPASGSGSG